MNPVPALFALGLAAAWVGLSRAWRGRFTQEVAPPGAVGGRPRRVRTRVRFFLPVPAFWRLEEAGAITLGQRPRSLRGFGWGWVRLEVDSTIEPQSRGVHPLARPRLFVRDAFGLLEREAPLAGEVAEVVVYPRVWPAGLPDLALTLLAEGPEARGVGLEDATRYRGVREYVPGDAWKRVHWKATARTGRLMVREFAPVRATGVWVYVDTVGAQEVFVDHMAELTASLALTLSGQGMAVGLAWPGGRLEPARGEEALRRLFDRLARLEPAREAGALPLPPAGVNLIVLTQHVPPEVIEGALRARTRAARVYLVAFPEGFFLRPGEKGRPVWGRTEGMQRLERRRALLAGAGVRTYVVRGNERVRLA